MFGEHRHRIHGRGALIANGVTSAFLTAGSLLLTLIVILILFFGVASMRAT
jgi:hypothetical protein